MQAMFLPCVNTGNSIYCNGNSIFLTVHVVSWNSLSSGNAFLISSAQLPFPNYIAKNSRNLKHVIAF